MADEFPKALYREGTSFEWEGKLLDAVTVNDADEEKAARAEGYTDATDDAPKKRPRKAAD